MAAYPVVILGRLGTPDALAALLAILGLFLLDRENYDALALAILFLSLGVRTDSVLLLLAVLAWLVREKRIAVYSGGLLAVLAVAIVFAVNRWAGSYGWIVLFRFSFVGGRYPSQLPHVLSLREYFSTLVRGASVIFSHLSIWLLLGILAWLRRPTVLLPLIGIAALAHFLLYPSPEDRYFIWAYIVTGIALVRSFEATGTPSE
jgi:Gpi18-like mannosyltransferase